MLNLTYRTVHHTDKARLSITYSKYAQYLIHISKHLFIFLIVKSLLTQGTEIRLGQ